MDRIDAPPHRTPTAIRCRLNRGLRLTLLAAAALSAIPCGAAPASAARTERGLVILVEFPDVPHRVQRGAVAERFNRDLAAYVREMSHGTVDLSVDLTPRWHRLPSPVGDYRISSRNLEVDHGRIRKLIDDSLAAVEGEVDFSRYSFTAVLMGARLQDYGMIGLCGYPGMLGWSERDALRTRGGQRVPGGVAIFSFQAHLGTLFHDIAHVLGGVADGKRRVPCLYDHDLQARPGPQRETFVDAAVNMGFWDPMSCHFIRWETPPPGISSWTRLRLGWLDTSRVRTVARGETAEVLLGPLEDGSSPVLAVRIPLSDSTFYLVENRQPLGFDRSLPGSGVLVMYADDRVAECRHGQAPVKLAAADPSRPRLEGAAFTPGPRDTFRDEARGVSVRVREAAGATYRLTVVNGSAGGERP
jgi:M6 family metalloprotease-like protein